MAARWADEAFFGIWQEDSKRRPTWRDASARVTAQPRFAPIDHPSRSHRERRVRPARLVGFDIPIPRLRPSTAIEPITTRTAA